CCPAAIMPCHGSRHKRCARRRRIIKRQNRLHPSESILQRRNATMGKSKTTDPEPNLSVVLLNCPEQRRIQIIEVGVHLKLSCRSVNCLLFAERKHAHGVSIIDGMLAAQRLQLTACRQLLQRILTNRLEHPEAWPAVHGYPLLDQTL